MRRVLCFGLLLLALSNSSAGAADKTTREADSEFSYSPNWPEPPDTSGMLLRLAFGTVATLGLCAATLVFGRRWLQRPAASGSAQKMQIVGSVVLGHRATLFLVKVGDSHLVAGADAGGLKSLLVLPTMFQEVLDQQVEAADIAPADSVPIPATVVWNAAAARAA